MESVRVTEALSSMCGWTRPPWYWCIGSH